MVAILEGKWNILLLNHGIYHKYRVYAVEEVTFARISLSISISDNLKSHSRIGRRERGLSEVITDSCSRYFS